MSRHIPTAALVAVALITAWCYIPPIGSVVALNDLEPFLEPDVAHGRPAFVQTKEHVYYRVRLNTVVEPWYSWTYFQWLRQRGVQFQEVSTSPHLPIQRRYGWKIAMARVEPGPRLTFTYWKSTDYQSGTFPVKLRWPWLYVRLGSDVVNPRSVSLPPERDAVSLPQGPPRFPGAILTEAASEQWRIHLRYAAPADCRDVVQYYANLLGVSDLTGDQFEAKATGSIAQSLRIPEAVQFGVANLLFADDPLVIYAPEHMPSSTDIPEQQPEGMRELPPVCAFKLNIHYKTEDISRDAFAFMRAGK